MDDTLTTFMPKLDELGIRATVLRRFDARRATVRLARGRSAQDYELIHGDTVTSAEVARPRESDQPLLVFTAYAGPRIAETFRRGGVQYLDRAGDAWIAFGDVLVDVRGRPRPERPQPRTRLAGNLFTSSRARVVCVLLTWPQLWHASRREVARAAGVSLGQAHNALTLLAEAGYDQGISRSRQDVLLDLWAAAFPIGLAANLTLATFRGDAEKPKVAKAGDRIFVSGERAVEDLLRPATLTLYVNELDPRLPVANRWRADGIPNIVVRQSFWHAPEERWQSSGVDIAPWPIVYADLLASDDPRVRSTATPWKERVARPV